MRLGENWHALSAAEKQPYYDQAEKIKAEHKKEHPGMFICGLLRLLNLVVELIDQSSLSRWIGKRKNS